MSQLKLFIRVKEMFNEIVKRRYENPRRAHVRGKWSVSPSGRAMKLLNGKVLIGFSGLGVLSEAGGQYIGLTTGG